MVLMKRLWLVGPLELLGPKEGSGWLGTVTLSSISEQSIPGGSCPDVTKGGL